MICFISVQVTAKNTVNLVSSGAKPVIVDICKAEKSFISATGLTAAYPAEYDFAAFMSFYLLEPPLQHIITSLCFFPKDRPPKSL
ncbi:MAG: hypothetical protein HQK97_09120 [Nitrospirae bacterium]|nr:hypothetical protein [Nitrospirota bacterium]